jgi:hypothetical protein
MDRLRTLRSGGRGHTAVFSECPGCGLTRSIIELAHGNLESSLASHRLGLLLAGAIAYLTAAGRRDSADYPVPTRLPPALATN